MQIMKKIIAAIDGLKYSESAVQYAIEIAKQNDAYLVAVFLDDFTYHSYKIFELLDDDGVSTERKAWFEKKDGEKRHESVERFSEGCRQAGVQCSVHHDRNLAIQELLHESIYADLVIIDAKETLTHFEENKPTRFIRDLLSQVQCPVMVVPQDYRPIEKAVLLYDGEPTSVSAIRSFSYLLPSLKQLEIEVLSVNSEKQTLHIPDNRLMKEFMKRHFPKAVYTVVKGDPEVEIVKKLRGQTKNTLAVLGAYSRGMVSRWFKASMADTLMQELSLPLFIAHYK
jgi:nucleotide-binding universal stress UspA family protein